MNVSRSVRRAGPHFGRAFGGISAIGTKELRGRMRGRRAFVALTFYLTLLAGFAWMLEALQASSFQNSGFGGATYQSSQIGTGIFAGLLILQTLLILILAPAFTTGAISQEREKQTLDLLVTTPISSLSIVLGKLFSALAWAFLLVVASIPLTAMVFVFGGVGPEDLVRGYVVLLVEVFGLGCVGLFFSALLKRTLAATIATYSVVLAMTVGATFFYAYLSATGGGKTVVQPDGSTFTRPQLAPEALLWFNPFVADLDVMCPTGTGVGGTCTIIAAIMGQDQTFGGRVNGGVVVAQPAPVKVLPDGTMVMPDGTIILPDGSTKGGAVNVVPQPLAVAVNDPTAGGIVRDAYWPRSALAWLVLSIVLVLLSVNLVSPTRRWRPRLRRGRGAQAAAIGPTGDGAASAGAVTVDVPIGTGAGAVNGPGPAADPAAVIGDTPQAPEAST
jgi:ABC-type transport system involved in multi-copper enzyme maturation permease subunit